MKFTSSQQSGVTILRLAGSLLGGPDAGALKTRLGELVEAGKNRVVLDLREVEFMNSSGLAMLINTMTTVRNSGGDLKLANASAKIGALITVTRLASVLQTYPSVEEAVAALKK
jgi:anti-sigma B factor antagonist